MIVRTSFLAGINSSHLRAMTPHACDFTCILDSWSDLGLIQSHDIRFARRLSKPVVHARSVRLASSLDVAALIVPALDSFNDVFVADMLANSPQH